MFDGLAIGIIFSLFLNCVILYCLTVMFPSNGKFRQYVVIFVAESLIGYQDMKDDVMSVIMHLTAKPQTNPKQRMNGLLNEYFASL